MVKIKEQQGLCLAKFFSRCMSLKIKMKWNKGKYQFKCFTLKWSVEKVEFIRQKNYRKSSQAHKSHAITMITPEKKITTSKRLANMHSHHILYLFLYNFKFKWAKIRRKYQNSQKNYGIGNSSQYGYLHVEIVVK